MIKLTDREGRSHYLAPDNIARITEAGASSQWHGIRAFVKTHDGVTLEVQESADQIAALITNTIPAAPAAPQPAAQQRESLIRYCPGCGSIGPVDYSKHRDCCPDGNEARMIPQALAQKCHDTFRIAVSGSLQAEAEIAGHEAANGHLSRMVDELRELAQDAKQAMTALHQAAIPDESQEGVPAIIPHAAFRRFVDAHAQLCFCLHQLGHDGPREQPQRYQITSIKYLAGELTLRALGNDLTEHTLDGTPVTHQGVAEVPQSLEAGQVVTLK